MSNKLHAYSTSTGNVYPTKTERGAKRCATRNGGDCVGYLSTISNMFICTHEKVNGKWVKA